MIVGQQRVTARQKENSAVHIGDAFLHCDEIHAENISQYDDRELNRSHNENEMQGQPADPPDESFNDAGQSSVDGARASRIDERAADNGCRSWIARGPA